MPDGTCVLVGVPSEKVTIYTLPIHFNKVLTGSHGGDARPHVDIPRIIRLMQGRPALVRRHHHAHVPARRDQCGARPGAQRQRRPRAAEDCVGYRPVGSDLRFFDSRATISWPAILLRITYH